MISDHREPISRHFVNDDYDDDDHQKRDHIIHQVTSNHLLELQKEIKEEQDEIFANINNLISGRSCLYSGLLDEDDRGGSGSGQENDQYYYGKENKDGDDLILDHKQQLQHNSTFKSLHDHLSYSNNTINNNNNINNNAHLNLRYYPHNSNSSSSNNSNNNNNNNNSSSNNNNNNNINININNNSLSTDSTRLFDSTNSDDEDQNDHPSQSIDLNLYERPNYQAQHNHRVHAIHEDKALHLSKQLQEQQEEFEDAGQYRLDQPAIQSLDRQYFQQSRNNLHSPDPQAQIAIENEEDSNDQAHYMDEDLLDPSEYQQKYQAVIQQVTNNLPKPCVFFLEGNCRRSDCKFSHDLSTITCKYWIEGFCFKGDLCPFLHSYNPDDLHDPDSLDDEGIKLLGRQQLNPTFVIESEADFPSLPLDAPTNALNDSSKSSIETDIIAATIKNQILSSNPSVVFKTTKKKRKKG